jgi:acyl dehydratase
VSIQVGQVASTKRTFTQSDFDRFAALSGDDNPIHVDPEFAARTKFGRTVAHGMFLYSLVARVLHHHLPGPGTVQIEQELIFPSPTFVGEEVEIRLEVTQIEPAAGTAELSTLILRPNSEPGLQGRTRVRLPQYPMPDIHIPNNQIPSSRFPDSRSLKGMTPGQHAHTQRTFTAGDLAEYANLVGDHNPLYTKPKYAQKMGLAGLVVPGGLLGGLFSYLLGTELPGRGTNYLKQRLCFPRPAYVDQPLNATAKVTRIRPEKQLVNLSTVCTDASDHIVCHGEALVLVSDVGGAA